MASSDALSNPRQMGMPAVDGDASSHEPTVPEPIRVIPNLTAPSTPVRGPMTPHPFDDLPVSNPLEGSPTLLPVAPRTVPPEETASAPMVPVAEPNKGNTTEVLSPTPPAVALAPPGPNLHPSPPFATTESSTDFQVDPLTAGGKSTAPRSPSDRVDHAFPGNIPATRAPPPNRSPPPIAVDPPETAKPDLGEGSPMTLPAPPPRGRPSDHITSPPTQGEGEEVPEKMVATWVNNIFIMGNMAYTDPREHFRVPKSEKLLDLRAKLFPFLRKVCSTPEFKELEALLEEVDPTTTPPPSPPSCESVPTPSFVMRASTPPPPEFEAPKLSHTALKPLAVSGCCRSTQLAGPTLPTAITPGAQVVPKVPDVLIEDQSPRSLANPPAVPPVELLTPAKRPLKE